LGHKSGDPSTDNDGAGLLIGAVYFNTTNAKLLIYTSSGWVGTALPSASVVASFNGRTGSVVPVSGDYDIAKITGLQTALDGKAPLTSPALTGAPTAPTAGPTTNTTQVATTAFVQALAGGRAPLDSPAFTGTPTAPTATAGTNTTPGGDHGLRAGRPRWQGEHLTRTREATLPIFRMS
jgi:hypothetical protein